MTTEEYLAFEARLLEMSNEVLNDKNSQVCANPIRVKAYIEETQRQRKEAKDQVEGLEEDVEMWSTMP